MKLSHKIQAASLLPFLAIIVAYHFYSTSAFNDQIGKMYRNQTQGRLLLAEKDITHYFKALEEELALLASIVPLDEEQPSSCEAPLQALLQHVEGLRFLSVINDKGREWKRVEKAAKTIPEQSLGAFGHSDVYRLPMEKRVPFWGNIDWLPKDPFPVIEVSVPLQANEERVISGVLRSGLSFRDIAPLLKRNVSEEDTVVLLSESAGFLIASDTDDDYTRLKTQLIKDVREMSAAHGWLEKEYDHSGSIYIYNKFKYRNLDFILVSFRAEGKEALVAGELKSFNLVFVVLGIVLFIISSFFIITTITTPLVNLTEQITKLRSKYRPKSGFAGLPYAMSEVDEVEELRNSFFLFQHQLSLYSSERETFQQSLQGQVVEKTLELRQLNEALERSNIMLQADIAKRKEVERELADYQGNLERVVKERTIELTLANEHLREQIEEREKMKEELFKAKKLEAIGILAGGIAHDFNNILVAIMGNISLALRVASTDLRVSELLEEAQKGSRRACDLTKQLLTFSRGGHPIKRTSHIQDVIKECAEFIIRGSSLKSEYVIAEDLWPAVVDTGQISQVIQNIMLNARQAMDDQGIVIVCCVNYLHDASSSLPLKNGDYVRISITDQGGGIPDKLIDTIFDPYMTTKAKGNGLGLAICHSIVTKHGGHITVSSVAGQGAVFDIYLPASKNDAVQARETLPAVMEKSASSHTVLVMDDDDLVRNIAKSILEQFGYGVVLAKDGKEAVSMYRERCNGAGSVDLLIMDLTIPGGMGGKEAAREILQTDPQAKIIVSSGYSNAPVMATHEAYGFCGVIHKPFQVEDFISVVQASLGTDS